MSLSPFQPGQHRPTLSQLFDAAGDDLLGRLVEGERTPRFVGEPVLDLTISRIPHVQGGDAVL